MNTLKAAAILSSALLLAANAAHSESTLKTNIHNYHFMAKRPYQEAVVNTAQQKDLQWEGATLIAAEDRAESAVVQHQNLRVNMLSKRPY